MIRLVQIPFSHNCIKVRRALDAKGLAYETLDVPPTDRRAVVAASGQAHVPVLVDGGRSIPESTAILRHLEQAYPEPSLLPAERRLHAECWLIEDWSDRAFMALARRLAYWRLLRTPERVAARFFPRAGPLKRRVMMVAARRVLIRRFRLSGEANARDERDAPWLARLALERLAGKALFFDRVTVADLTLAALTAPLWCAADHVRDDPAVRELLSWGRPLVGDETLGLYGVAAEAAAPQGAIPAGARRGA